MTDPRLTCDHRRLGFESNSLRIHCQDCDQVWVTVRSPSDDRPDLTASNRGNAPFIDVVAMRARAERADEHAAAVERAGAEQARRADQAAEDLRVALKERDEARAKRDEWKAGVENIERVTQAEARVKTTDDLLAAVSETLQALRSAAEAGDLDQVHRLAASAIDRIAG